MEEICLWRPEACGRFTTTDMAAHFIDADNAGNCECPYHSHIYGDFLFGSVPLFAERLCCLRPRTVLAAKSSRTMFRSGSYSFEGR